MSNSSDPYISLEKKLKLTQSALKVLKSYDVRLMIVTKSDLVTRDIDILKNFSKVIVAISITSLHKTLAKKLEPFAPSPQNRLKAIQTLSPHIPVICRLDPFIPGLNIQEVKTIVQQVKNAGSRQIITSTYKAKPDNFKRMKNAFPEKSSLWNELYVEKISKKAGYTYLPLEARKKMIKEVKDIILSEGLAFSSCREGLKQLNTCNCDGSSFFSK
jgi:DNA repair photolyase